MKKLFTTSKKSFDLKLLWRILHYLKSYKLFTILSLFCIIILAGLSPIRPWLVQYTIDHAIAYNDSKLIMWLSISMIGLLAIEMIIQFFDSYLSTWLGQKVIKDIRTQVYNAITKFELSYFDKNAVGTLVTRSVSDTEAIADIFSQGLLTIIGDLLKLSVLLVAMFTTDWILALVSISTIPILFLATMWFKNAVKKSFNEVRNAVSQLNAFVQERINGISIIQAFNLESIQQKKFEEINETHTRANIKSIWAYSIFFPIVEILSSLSLGLLVWFGAQQVIDAKIQLGHLVAFIMYINMLFRPIRMLADRFNTLQMGMVAAERVFKVLDTPHNEKNTGKVKKEIKGEIEFKNVWFAYEKDNWVLKNINIHIQPGEKVALVGTTGSGKTTLTALINRFYKINLGEILLDKTPIQDFDLNALRKQIGVVLQDVFLFSDTILNNITLGNPKISQSEVEHAAKIIGANYFIDQLPERYNFNVLEKGATLSAGQKQLISILRAYVHKPAVLILDEATANIDSESELLIQKAITELTQNRTSIIVAHRLSTIKNANRIIVLEKGEIAEIGNHTELMKLKGKYYNLVQKHSENNQINV